MRVGEVDGSATEVPRVGRWQDHTLIQGRHRSVVQRCGKVLTSTTQMNQLRFLCLPRIKSVSHRESGRCGTRRARNRLDNTLKGSCGREL